MKNTGDHQLALVLAVVDHVALDGERTHVVAEFRPPPASPGLRGQHREPLNDDVDHPVRPCFVRVVGDICPKAPADPARPAETADSASALLGTDLSTVGFDSGGKATGGCLVVKCSLSLCDLSEAGSNIGTESSAFLVTLFKKPQRLAHDLTRRLVHPIVLQNTDGDPLELTTLTYELGVTAAEAVERLTPLATLRGEVHVAEEAYDAKGGLVAANLTWIKAGNRKHKDWDNTTLGTLRIDGSRLVVEINSVRRRRRIEKEIAKRLGSSATIVEATVTDIGEALEQRRDAGPTGLAAGSSAATERPRTPELHAIEAELARRHWEAWLETKVPALGHRTPRQATKTARGRERLEALLADYSQSGASGSNAFAPDIGALRRTLGLE